MARIRKFIAYRKLERPYTRISKYKKLSYVKVAPHKRIARFVTGNQVRKFSLYMHLISKADIQIRDNAIESARVTANKILETVAGTQNYFFQVRMYPFHILRENPLAAGAGADRFSTGMSHSFGKPIGRAAQVWKGKILFSLGIEEQHKETGKKALLRAKKKLPCNCTIVMEKRILSPVAAIAV
ncbi:50S ribosomal protein L16, partial [Candidatus Woesearchaeota archaeon]|nr:50S ribosomal protein L16 [Candidatus Woesearchaeota archaeon]